MRKSIFVVAGVVACLGPGLLRTARADRFARGQLAYQTLCAHCHTVAWKSAGAAEKDSVDLTRVVDHKGDEVLRKWMSDAARGTKSSPCHHQSLGADQVDDLINFLHVRAQAAPEKPRVPPRTMHRQAAFREQPRPATPAVSTPAPIAPPHRVESNRVGAP